MRQRRPRRRLIVGRFFRVQELEPNGVGSGTTYATPQRVFDCQTSQPGRRRPGGEQEGLRSRMRLANRTTTKTADPFRGRATDPATHAARSGSRRWLVRLDARHRGSLVLGRGHLGQSAIETLHQRTRHDFVQPNLARGLGERLVTPEATYR